MLRTYILRIKKYCCFRNKNFVGILFIIPCILFLLLIVIYPELFAIKMSFFDWKITAVKAPQFVGIKNYLSALTNYKFWNSIRVTMLFGLISLAIEFPLGVSLALLINREFRGKSIVRNLFTVPMVVAPICAGVIFRLMYHPEYGIINQILGFFHIAPIMWLSSSLSALFAVSLCEVWQSVPFILLVTLAGLETLPRDPLEAAIVDGANSVQGFFYVTLPLLSKLLLIVLLIRLTDIIVIFDSIYVMTKGGPGTSTEVLGLYMYKEGFKFFKTGYTSAVSIIVLVVIGGVIAFSSRLKKGGEDII